MGIRSGAFWLDLAGATNYRHQPTGQLRVMATCTRREPAGPSIVNLRTCIATGRFPRAGETFVNRHIAHLSGGNTVVLCGRRVGTDTLDKPVFSRLRAALNPADLALAPWHFWRNHRLYSAPFVPFGRGRAALERFLQDQRVDAVLAEFGSQAVSVWPVARAMGLPVFTFFRGRDASRYLHVPWRVEGYRRMMPHLAGVFAVSQYLLDNLAAHGLTHANAHVVPSGTDIDSFRPGSKEPGKMLFVGRFVEKKAPQVVLSAFLGLAERHAGARLDLIGDGPLLSRCRGQAAASPHAARVRFLGHLPPGEVRHHLARASIFALPAVTGRDGETEGLPSAIQEAMAAGAAVLSTRHAGIPELVIEGQTGCLSAEGDASGFAAAMDRMLASPEMVAAFGQHARQVAEERLDYRRLYAHVEAVIGEAVARRVPAAGAAP